MSDPDDYADEWDDLDDKTLLASILAEQQRTNQLLAELAGDGDTPTQEADPVYRCDYCDAEVPEGKRQRHAEGQHNTPPGAWEQAFTRVE